MSETMTLLIRVVPCSRDTQPSVSYSSATTLLSICSSFCRRRVATTCQLASERR